MDYNVNDGITEIVGHIPLFIGEILSFLYSFGLNGILYYLYTNPYTEICMSKNNMFLYW